MIDISRNRDFVGVRVKVLDLVHKVTLVMGSITLLIGLGRVLEGTADVRASLWNAIFLAIVAGLWVIRARVPTEWRAAFVLGSISAGGTVGLILHGSSSPAGTLLLSVFVLTWLLLPRRWAWSMYAVEFVEFVFAAESNIRHGSSVDAALPFVNRTAVMWVNLGVCYALVAGLVLAAVLVLVGELEENSIRLSGLNEELENRVLLRTADIQRERESIETFSYTVSHDLRAPLRAIDGFARVLQEDFGGSLPGEALSLIGRITAATERMGRLIQALLGLSRLGRQDIVLHEVDVEAVVRETIEELTTDGTGRVGLLEDGAAVWQVGHLPCVHSDPDMVRRVFANLLGNAWKFTRREGAPRIRVEGVQRPDGTWYEISDNGLGFDMAQADRMFKAFQRLHGDSIDGVGIGLATVRRILDRLGGDIEAHGAVGGGATFRFRLGPAAKTETTRMEPVRS
ncbi:MAG TPA: ATP-binding protein [Fibrobacteria bacterium]|nr:ATP-binding protein [Fibrobacteria bacterium]